MNGRVEIASASRVQIHCDRDDVRPKPASDGAVAAAESPATEDVLATAERRCGDARSRAVCRALLLALMPPIRDIRVENPPQEPAVELPGLGRPSARSVGRWVELMVGKQDGPRSLGDD